MNNLSIQPVLGQLEGFISQYIAQISTKDAKQIETLNNLQVVATTGNCP